MSVAVSVADAERAYLADLLESLGPDAPTLCDGWQALDLAAHLVVREHRPDAAIGIALPPAAGWTQRVQDQYRKRGLSQLVSMIRQGPPVLSPWSLPAVAGAANSVEYFVHHEDVRRAQPGWEPRSLDADVEDFLWSRLARQGRLMFRRAPVGVSLQAPGREARVARRGQPEVTVAGPPAELLLFAFGRGEHARVELRGEAEACRLLRSTRLGL